MIYRPQNVFPHNNTIDAALQNTFTFMFTGTNATCWDYVFYDANNNNIVRRSYKSTYGSNIYNNEEVKTSFKANTFENGNNYKYRMNIYQEKFDIFVMQGTVRNITEITLTDSQIPITYGIDNIREPIYYTIGGKETLVGACYMEIDDGTIKEKRMITSYNPNAKYGSDDGYGNYDYKTYVEIDVPFSVKPTEGTTYRIFCNYITSPEYYFQCRKTPVTTPTIALNEWGNIECHSTYYQEQGVDVKNYQYSLYKKQVSKEVLNTTVANYVDTELADYVSLNSIPVVRDHSGEPLIIGNTNYYLMVTYNIDGNTQISDTKPIERFDFDKDIVFLKDDLSAIPPVGATALIFMGSETLVRQSDVIYNSRLSYEFNDVVRNIDYRVVLKITTQDNMEHEVSVMGIFNSVATRQDGDYVICESDSSNNSIALTYSIWENHSIIVIREDVVSGASERVVFGSWSHIGHESWSYIDHQVSSNKIYRYHFIPIVKDGSLWKYGDEYISNIIYPEWCYWTIKSLIPTNEIKPDEPNRELFRLGEIWKFAISAEESELTQNITRVLHTGQVTKPQITMGINNYISGSFSCNISKVIAPNDIKDDIYMVESWRKFISENSAYLLQNPKGDIFVIGISDSPTATYDYSSRKKLTKISFNFTEIRNKDDISIL